MVYEAFLIVASASLLSQLIISKRGVLQTHYTISHLQAFATVVLITWSILRLAPEVHILLMLQGPRLLLLLFFLKLKYS